ncbi:hypothetical protein N7513_002479 [Penicillium frequentans]|nr:hypothetical protein N7513_002479 [Penicillium glabrum]
MLPSTALRLSRPPHLLLRNSIYSQRRHGYLPTLTTKSALLTAQNARSRPSLALTLTSTSRIHTTAAQSLQLDVKTPNPATHYIPPQTGLVASLPSSWIPYAELVRLDKPTGTYYLFFPTLFSTLLAAPMATHVTPLQLLGTAGLFSPGP